MASKIQSALKDLVEEAQAVAERLEIATEKFSLALPDPDESSTITCIDTLTDAEDISDYPEEFGNLVGGELFVHGSAFMSQAGTYLVNICEMESDFEIDKTYAPKFRLLLDDFVDDYTRLYKEWKQAQHDEQ